MILNGISPNYNVSTLAVTYCQNQSDSIIWLKSCNGKFSVKYPYREVLSLQSQSPITSLPPTRKLIIKHIWKIGVKFPQVSLFMWRLVNNVIPLYLKNRIFKFTAVPNLDCPLWVHNQEFAVHPLVWIVISPVLFGLQGLSSYFPSLYYHLLMHLRDQT